MNRLLLLGGGGGSGAGLSITSSSTASNAENSVLAHALTASQSVTWSLVSGADLAKFELSGSTLRWLSNGTKNYEAPDDADTNNTYIVTVRATNGSSDTTDQTVTVTVTDVSEGPDAAILWAWFKPETLGSNGSAISTLTDSSANGRNGTQGTGANQPVVSTGELNGFSAISFVDNTDSIQLPSMAALTAGSAFLVLKASDDTSTHGFPIQASTGGGEAHYPFNSTQVYANFGSTTRPLVFDPTAYNIDTYHILSLHSAAGDKRIYIGNVLVYSSGTNTVAFSSTPAFGLHAGNFYGWIGKLVEATIFTTAMTTGERNAEYARLAAKYGL